MPAEPNYFLIAGGAMSAVAAALHLGCILFGASWYRFLGAGEKMARLAEAGSSYPARVTLVITAMLLVWSAYALSGAGVIPRLPLLRTILCAIAAVYLFRGFVFYPLMPLFPGNSTTFWLVSGAICAAIGVVHAIGITQAWPVLSLAAS
jgi:hypothetical protein